MRCNPLRWLWGLIPIAMLCWVTVLGERDRIEGDLRKRTTETLGKAGLSWGSTGFNGRDAVLNGIAGEDGESAKASDLVRDTWGVRVVENRAELPEKVDVYNWTAAIRDGKLRLTGYVPNEATRKAIAGVAKASFPKVELDDRTKLARGAPPRDTWLAGVSFALKHLATLNGGQVDLEGTNLSVAGAAETPAGFKTVKTALAGGLPQGIKLKADKVTPPTISPYTWNARHEQNQLNLTGHVPSETVRRQIADAAKAAFPRATVNDRMELGDGAPDGFAAATVAALRQLARLEDGNADIRAQQLTVAGMATDDVIAETVRKALKDSTPQAFRLAETIKFRAPAIPTIRPYRTMVEATTSSVVLTGHVPTDAAKNAVAEAARARLPGRRIDNKLELGKGEPQGWLPCLQLGLAGLGRLGSGNIDLTDRNLRLTGETNDRALHDSLPGELDVAIGSACNADVKIGYNDTHDRAAEEARQRAEAEARRRTDEQAALLAKRRADEQAAAEARRRAEEQAAADARRRAEEQAAADARRRADEQAAAKRRADEAAEARRRQELASTEATRRVEAERCQTTLRTAAAAGVIRFPRASAELEPASLPTIQQLARVITACPNVVVEIEGHTDAEGAPDRNQRLSERRAQTIVARMTELGVAAEKLSAIGYGETRPIAPNDTADNRAMNRRIEFTVKTKN